MTTATGSHDYLRQRALGARQAALQLATSDGGARDAALQAILKALDSERERILAANAADVEAGKALVEQGELGEPLLKRLELREGKYQATREMVRSVIAQPDPLWSTLKATKLDEGLNLYRVSVPIGVIGVIFESRPDALVQIAALCLKSGNAVLLKGGSEAANSNAVLAEVIEMATASVEGIPDGWITLMESREDVKGMLCQEDAIDLIIPRGSPEFAGYIMANTNIPVTGHTDGICHVFVDAAADLDKAVRITVDSKISGVATCCASETLLVHGEIARPFFERVIGDLEAHNVLIRGDERTLELAGDLGALTPVSEQDWSTEYLDYILSVKIVDGAEEAIDHINHYSSHHTDSIVTEDKTTAKRFLLAIDSASVFHNASTRLADGFKFGLGAEVGISTGRLHSRGPVGLEGLTCYKYVLEGSGQTATDFDGEPSRPFLHRSLDAIWSMQANG
ncbi:MAG: glutamate-5-semialdehyde dehydrogenase [Candidatus Latescibacterota bacterium]|nr:glutamate-5-semialdehyde dehydrogenase [Candidatus Latescibacterota bacterium]